MLHTAFGYTIGRGWQAGLRFSIYSGALTGTDEEAEEGSEEASEQVRDPAYYRMDFRVEKKWRILSKRAWISLVLEMINATLNKETLGGSSFGPVTIPSIGLEGGF